MQTTSISDRPGYKNVCEWAIKDERVFKNFKRYQEYRKILEHVSRKHGKLYLNEILKDGKDLLKFLDQFKKNDMYGNPHRSFYLKTGRISPTTLRYVKVLSDLQKFFGNFNGWNIVEIGGGYGGQCKIISDVHKFKSYSIFDLDIALKLTKKYLDRLHIHDIRYLSLDQFKNNMEIDLIISNYGFSEIVDHIQKEYIKKVITKSKRGYITYNSISKYAYSREKIIKILNKHHDIRILEENPKTHRDNFIIVWDDT